MQFAPNKALFARKGGAGIADRFPFLSRLSTTPLCERREKPVKLIRERRMISLLPFFFTSKFTKPTPPLSFCFLTRMSIPAFYNSKKRKREKILHLWYYSSISLQTLISQIQISSSRDKIAPLLARSILDPISRSKAEALPRYSHKCKLRVELDLSYVHALRPTAMNIRDARFSTREQQ